MVTFLLIALALGVHYAEPAIFNVLTGDGPAPVVAIEASVSPGVTQDLEATPSETPTAEPSSPPTQSPKITATPTATAVIPTATPTSQATITPTPVLTPTTTPEVDVEGDCDKNIHIERNNEDTGDGSTNENEVHVSIHCDEDAPGGSSISNSVKVDADTGGNTGGNGGNVKIDINTSSSAGH